MTHLDTPLSFFIITFLAGVEWDKKKRGLCGISILSFIVYSHYDRPNDSSSMPSYHGLCHYQKSKLIEVSEFSQWKARHFAVYEESSLHGPVVLDVPKLPHPALEEVHHVTTTAAALERRPCARSETHPVFGTPLPTPAFKTPPW